jgi:hypothetical protein
MLCMRNNSSLILILFILPEVEDFSNLKPFDIINSGRSSDPEVLIPYLRSGICFGILRLSHFDDKL